jgi:PAS domain S-box-containing protein
MPSAVPARPVASRPFVGGAVALLVAFGLCALTASSYASAAGWVMHSLEVQNKVDAWTTTLLEIQNDTRAYIASGNPDFLQQQPERLEAAPKELAELRQLVADNAPQLAAVDSAGRHADAAIGYFEGEMAFVKAGERAQALARLTQGDGQRLMRRFADAAAKVRRSEELRLAQRRRELTHRAWATLFGAGAVAVLACALLMFAWRRELRHEARLVDLAKVARHRLRVLSELASALAAARSVKQVAEVVVEQGLRAAMGDTCTVYRLDARGQALELLSHRGIDPEIVERVRIISEQRGNSETLQSMKDGRSVWAENESDYAAIYPRLANVKVSGQRAKAFWSVPLVAEGRALGLLGVGFYEPRTFSVDERAFVDTLAHQCAQALLRASRTEAEEETRQWFSTTLRSIGDAVIATDEHGVVRFINPVAERLTGWSETEALGQPLEAVFHIISERTRAVVESPVAKVLREGKVVGLANHTVLMPKVGLEIPIDDSGAPIRNEAGSIVGVVLVFRDVSQEKRHENQNEFLARAGEALVSSLDHQITLGNVARFAVPRLADWCAVDLLSPSTGRIERVAVAHADPAKVSLALQLGQRYPPAQDAPSGVPHVVRSGKSELYTELSPELLDASARDPEHLSIIRELKLRSAMIVPLHSRGRSFGALTFVYADSERRYTAEDLAFAEDLARRAAMAIENSLALKEAADARDRERWLREEAERTNRLKDDFLATASHELRTPLNAILGWILTLRRGSHSAETDRALAIVERNARAQAKLIEDVLDVSRIVSGKLSLHLGPTSVAAAARAAIETITPAADAKGITLVTDIGQEPSTITADADRLQQVIWNLLSNSLKFTGKDGTILLRVFRDASDVCVLVKDNGEGIRPELLTAIFEPFQQADSSTTRRHGGLGLGLSIVKQLVVAHGGSVQAESAGPGRGSSFTVRVPLRAVAASNAEPSDAPTTASRDPLVATAPHARLDGLRVLVVDDEPDARSLVQEILLQHGAEVQVAQSAAEARQALNLSKPDVIVSDIGMPDEDGYSFIRQVRAAGSRTPAIALTAYASQQDAERAFVAGFQKHVTKPVEPTRLVSVVANLGGRSL